MPNHFLVPSHLPGALQWPRSTVEGVGRPATQKSWIEIALRLKALEQWWQGAGHGKDAFTI